MEQTSMTPTNKAFESHCTKLGMNTNSQIADAFGVNPSTVSRWISGETPLPTWASKILVYLESAVEQRNKAISWQRKYQDITGALQTFKRALENV